MSERELVTYWMRTLVSWADQEPSPAAEFEPTVLRHDDDDPPAAVTERVSISDADTPPTNSVDQMGLDSAALYAALDERRADRGLSWDALGREIGVATSTILRTRSGRAMECDGFLAMVRWLGRSPEEFAVDQPRQGVAIRPGRLDTPALHAALDRERLRRRLTWRMVADEMGPGVAPSMLTRLRSGGRASAGLVLRSAGWLEMSVNDFVTRRRAT